MSKQSRWKITYKPVSTTRQQ